VEVDNSAGFVDFEGGEAAGHAFGSVEIVGSDVLQGAFWYGVNFSGVVATVVSVARQNVFNAVVADVLFAVVVARHVVRAILLQARHEIFHQQEGRAVAASRPHWVMPRYPQHIRRRGSEGSRQPFGLFLNHGLRHHLVLA